MAKRKKDRSQKAKPAAGEKDKADRDKAEWAPESGEPGEAGRSRGRVIEETGEATGEVQQSPGREGEAPEDTESGRHGATP